mgnify:CR=1 FL=1
MAQAATPGYGDVVDAWVGTGMVARGGFVPAADDAVPDLDAGRPCRSVIVIGNVGGTMWRPFRTAGTSGPDPLDRWTRATLQPIASELGAVYVHPSDEPFQPFQRWAQRADDVWQSPIGLLVHPTYGLWHAYRGALLFSAEIDGLPPAGERSNPCLTCADQPCRSTCPVDAFTVDGYDSDACAGHVRSGDQPVCLDDGCAARRACPVGVEYRYGPDQMRFHMEAFVGMSE